MIAKIFLLLTVGFTAGQRIEDPIGPPQPYSFSYDITNDFGTRLSQSESGDANNVKTGTYSYSEANGVFRNVQYIADKDGFRATIDTNEPGTKSSAPADVVINSQVLLLACLAAYAAGQVVVQQEDGPPQPYSFNYDTTDEFGTRMTREETSDENNHKVGSYSYTDANGLTRTVRYVADADGFRVTVETNEPGTRTSNPADVQITSSAVEPPPTYNQPAPVAVHTVHAAPAAVAVHAAPAAGVALHAAPVAVHSTPVAVHAAPVAVHAAPVTLHAAPVSFATAQHAVPVTVVGRAKSR
ncbi:hypothetical protein HPB50_015334 [Hyalomma asiaticum]|uniref:Uncharacterized protein n=1 Tax=Hyalomma asiaticum TaxID=266040 RepID=A0ACB7SYQ4_HYAAI|nr:hypothetical protein HPB50_015334 [Hyalomma asiaticum]